jgi:hypothetical protein
MRYLSLLLPLLYATNSYALFEAHEWGTFTSLVGSNGISQNGMYHEDEPLPDFVHGFGFVQSMLPPPVDPIPTPVPPHRPCHNKGCFPDEFFTHNVVTQKMETPVIYFYTDAKRSLDVNVKFPEGVVTETFPAPVATFPSSGSIRDAANGDTTFHVDVLPAKTATLPAVDAANIYGHARNVDSNIVQSGGETEKFIFYRGIGRFQPRLGIASHGGNVTLDIARAADIPSALFLVHVDANGDGQLMHVSTYNGHGEVSAQNVAALEEHSDNVRKGIYRGPAMTAHLQDALTQAGLRTDEAAAMLATWERGYLQVPGLRLLYVLPRQETDAVLPLTITPAPERLTRVFVGRIEVLTDKEEHGIVDRVLAEREAFQPSSLGRFAEPMLRRALETYEARENAAGRSPDYLVVALFGRLIRDAAAN